MADLEWLAESLQERITAGEASLKLEKRAHRETRDVLHNLLQQPSNQEQDDTEERGLDAPRLSGARMTVTDKLRAALGGGAGAETQAGNIGRLLEGDVRGGLVGGGLVGGGGGDGGRPSAGDDRGRGRGRGGRAGGGGGLDEEDGDLARTALNGVKLKPSSDSAGATTAVHGAIRGVALSALSAGTLSDSSDTEGSEGEYTASPVFDRMSIS